MKTTILLHLLLLSTISFAQQRPTAEKPNVIIILTDDQGYADVGFNGSTEIPTPNIDRIANNGVVFTSGYVTYAVCGPSRAGLLTGRYQDKFGFSKNPLMAPKDSLMGLPLSEETIGAAMKKAGYSTVAFGKWHMGVHPSLRPNKRGFDEFYGFLSGGHKYFPKDFVLADIEQSKSQYDAYNTKLLRNTERVEESEYLTDALSREAVDFVERHQKEPFLMYLAYNAPHAPMEATEEYLNRFLHIKDLKRRTYAAMVSAVDDGVGELLDKLEELDIDENTLVFFLSDNGGPTSHNASDNSPLRGFKGDFFEGGVRVPFAVQWKGVIPAGATYDYPVSSLDIFSTAVALAKVTPKNELDGVNLIPYLTGEDKGVPHQELYWRNYNANKFAIRTLDSKQIMERETTYLFDIQKDIAEKVNLAYGQKDRVKAIEHLIKEWEMSLMDPVFMGLSEEKKYSELHPDRFDK
ncbi:sulfatase-like hydrolase/transferase [Algoriphagus halophytocola]|uniref:Sulfatase-like hydrolase/transferase n=1 Tax=Algoriphagus halophytocola TaxID=2991499 RepID=A0ABY6MEQ8_9BACT|nr:sulfatase-like hydrolase/transferase [Algoriphagus sp. TR-M5]UZD21415.1 sulfatase-like hydrolase/transferase [Algoriphagus sp. TR-M5]